MADTIYAPDPWSALSAQHSDIRREASVERGEIRYDVATKAADLRYATTVGQSDIRREQAEGFGSTKFAIATGNDVLNREILNSSHNTDSKVDEAADKIQQRAADFYISSQARDFDNSRDLAALRATTDMATQKLGADILLSGERSAAAAALAGEKTAAAAALAGEKAAAASALESARLGTAVALGQSQLSKEIFESKYDLSRQVANEGDATRALINSLKNDELNRMLIERNTDLQHCRHDYWGARDGLINSQFAALSSQVNSQVNALNSQISDTKQGMVNFGSMLGVGQNSTSNAVR